MAEAAKSTGTSPPERWLDKQDIAEHFACGVRWIEARLGEGLPSAMIAGRRKFKLSEVEDWLCREGHIQREPA